MTGITLILPAVLAFAAVALLVVGAYDAAAGGLTAHEEREPVAGVWFADNLPTSGGAS